MAELLSVEEAKKRISACVAYHSKRVSEQETDQAYYDDTFEVSIKSPFHVVRTGTGAKIVDDIVAHIETANPQAFRKPAKKTKEAREAAIKVARLLNNWLGLLRAEIEEAIKNAVLRGDGLFQVEYNDVYNEQLPNSLPIILTAPDPLYIFTEPYDALLPDRVVKQFGMSVNYVKSLYPEWIPPKRLSASKEVTYKAYWDKNWKYFEAGEQALQEDMMPNVYGFVPFVHFYSGFGKKSPQGKPEGLTVGKLKKIRGRLKQKCEVASRIDSILALYANPMRVLTEIAADAAEASRKELEEAYIGPGATLVAPYGWRQEIYVPNVHIEQLLTHLHEIDSAIGLEHPPIMSGVASGARTSGRLEDILYESVQKRYSKLVKNLCEALAAALGMGLRLLGTIPGALPITSRATIIEEGKTFEKVETITKEDIDGYYECEVQLNPEEAIEHDRKVMLGRILVNENRISWKQFLIEYMGMTEDEADTTMTDTIAERAILTDPMMNQIRTMEAIEQAGMTRYLEKLQQAGQQQMQTQPPFRPSEARSPTATGILRQALGEKGVVRTPPEGVTR